MIRFRIYSIIYPKPSGFFDVCDKIGIKKIILVSSGGTVYGKTQQILINEDHPTNPISPYGISKMASEKYAMMFNELRGLPIICVRPGNAYGEGQLPNVGQGFISTAIASILMQREVIIFGKTGTIRDYIYVTDVAKGIIATLERGKSGSYYNIGSGVGRSNKEVVDMIYPLAKSSKLEPQVKVMPSRKFDVPTNVLDSTRLMKDTGWKERVPFQEGIKKTWSWLLCNYKKYGSFDNKSIGY